MEQKSIVEVHISKLSRIETLKSKEKQKKKKRMNEKNLLTSTSKILKAI
jgi:hypothetical protein